jgi:hypothetical protein
LSALNKTLAFFVSNQAAFADLETAQFAGRDGCIDCASGDAYALRCMIWRMREWGEGGFL